MARALGENRDPVYAPDGRTWYETALAEAEKRGKFQDALRLIENHELRDHEDYTAIQDIATAALRD